MAKRKRRHIRVADIAASALADKLAQAVRDDLRERRVPARTVIQMFTPDHITLHAWGGSDRWWNLDMRARGPDLKAKDAADTSRAAKVLRVNDRWREFMRMIDKPKKKRKSRWPSRPFPKRKA